MTGRKSGIFRTMLPWLLDSGSEDHGRCGGSRYGRGIRFRIASINAQIS